MNPLGWKREHQIALLGAALIGLIVGLVFALHDVNPHEHTTVYAGSSGLVRVNTYWRFVVGWSLLGGGIAGGIFYIFQLSRS
jgi:hypothetical protein